MHSIVEGAATRLQEEQERTEAILSALGQGLFGLDRSGCVQFLNPACERMTGWTMQQLQGIPLHDLLHPPQRRTAQCTEDTCSLLHVLKHSVPRRVEQDRFQRQDGSFLPVSYFCTPVHRAGMPSGALICFDDITERLNAARALDEYSCQVKAQNEQLYSYCEELTATQKRLEQQAAELTEKNARILEANLFLKGLATTDGMTGLANHRAFQEALRTAWNAGRNQKQVLPLSLMFVDVDCFKAYNDVFGHPAGDEVLQIVARLLHENVRPSDLVARYGGEEFVVVAWDSDFKTTLRLAKRLCVVVERYSFANRKITISIGVATQNTQSHAGEQFPLYYETPDDLIKAADEALYEAKRTGRNRVCGAAGSPIEP